jgi:hypothetical protein
LIWFLYYGWTYGNRTKYTASVGTMKSTKDKQKSAIALQFPIPPLTSMIQQWKAWFHANYVCVILYLPWVCEFLEKTILNRPLVTHSL